MQRVHPNPFIHYALVIMIFAVGAATLMSAILFSAHGDAHSTTNVAQKCEGVSKTIMVRLENKRFDQESITANRCDTLTIINNDSGVYRLALGAHDSHMTYPGFNEKPLKPTQQMSIVLAQSGEYTMHDHLHETSETSLTIR